MFWCRPSATTSLSMLDCAVYLRSSSLTVDLAETPVSRTANRAATGLSNSSSYRARETDHRYIFQDRLRTFYWIFCTTEYTCRRVPTPHLISYSFLNLLAVVVRSCFSFTDWQVRLQPVLLVRACADYLYSVRACAGPTRALLQPMISFNCSTPDRDDRPT